MTLSVSERTELRELAEIYPIDKWVLMLLDAIGATVRNLYDVRWLATEDRSVGKGTGRHIACFILEPVAPATATPQQPTAAATAQDYQDTTRHEARTTDTEGE